MDRQRIDKWIWHARIVRTRSTAAVLVTGGAVRINGRRDDAPGRAVRAGDVITVALDRGVRVLKVIGFTERRGDAATVSELYEDLQPLPPRCEHPDVAAKGCNTGASRPTKRDRRMINRLRDED